MRKQFVECEDGRRREARIYGESWMEEGKEGYQPERRECAPCGGINPYDAIYCCYCGKQLPEFSDDESGADKGQDEAFTISEAAVRVKGKHVHGEAWFSCKTGIWYFLSSPDSKNYNLLPRDKKRPAESKGNLIRSPSVKTK